MTTPEAKLNASTELLAEALRKVFEEAQESTIFLMGEVEGRLDCKIGGIDAKVDGMREQMNGMREQMNGMSKKIDRLQAGH